MNNVFELYQNNLHRYCLLKCVENFIKILTTNGYKKIKL